MSTVLSPPTIFERDGFYIAENLLSAEIAQISNEVDKVITGDGYKLPDEDVVYEPNTSPPRVRNSFRLHQHFPYFLEAARNPGILDFVESVFGAPVRLYSSQLFAKPAGVGTAVPLHQDMPYWPFAPYEMMSCWIALDDSTIENGCVRYLTGSHKLGILDHSPSGVPGNSLGLDDPRIAGFEEKPAEVKRGSCIFHHSLTAHRSDPNQSNNARRGLIFVYMSERVQVTDASKLKGKIDFPVMR